MFILLLLGALKPSLCVVAPEALAQRLGPTWTRTLEGRLHRPVAVAQTCPGEALRVSLDGELVTLVYQPTSHSRTFHVDSEEVFALMAATLVDPSVPTPPPEVAPAPSHEHLWLYGGSGLGIAGGVVSLALHAGAAYRFERWALGAELLTLGNPGRIEETSSRLGLGPVLWYGSGSSLRLDGGLGLGFASVSAPWAIPSGSRYGELLAGLVRLMARLRWAPLRWLGMYARAEVGLAVSLGGASGVESFAALQVGVEVML